MFLLLTSSRLISLILGWDGLGVISYLLVLFYSQSFSSLAAKLTVLSNRIGDCFIIVFVCLMFYLTPLSNSPTAPSFSPYFTFKDILALSSLFILLASITKRAQTPFSSWLPAAMSAPTPVSSLVHSSTLVTAGLFLLLFQSRSPSSPSSRVFLTLSILTLIVSSLQACSTSDLKALIAYSTLSQLSLIFLFLYFNLCSLAYLHICLHAFFKRALFLRAGSFIHQIKRSQDSRNLSF